MESKFVDIGISGIIFLFQIAITFRLNQINKDHDTLIKINTEVENLKNIVERRKDFRG